MASRLFAPNIVANVFEPLVADWQREWADAQGPSRLTRLRAAIGGLSGFASTALLVLIVAVWIVPFTSSGLWLTASQNERIYQL